MRILDVVEKKDTLFADDFVKFGIFVDGSADNRTLVVGRTRKLIEPLAGDPFKFYFFFLNKFSKFFDPLIVLRLFVEISLIDFSFSAADDFKARIYAVYVFD